MISSYKWNPIVKQRILNLSENSKKDVSEFNLAIMSMGNTIETTNTHMAYKWWAQSEKRKFYTNSTKIFYWPHSAFFSECSASHCRYKNKIKWIFLMPQNGAINIINRCK